MLPEWDFHGDEAKRRAFIRWVWAELDRFVDLASQRYQRPEERDDWEDLLRGAVPVARGVGRPPDAFVGMNAMVWEFGLLRYMFRRYWPRRKRPRADAASAASIAVARCRKALARGQRTKDRLSFLRERDAELARLLFEEWERGSKSPGRAQAELDIAFLATLPRNRFADNYPGESAGPQ